uniref:Peptidase M14 carboxypeptidase A domain-containing protein n=1 Tax=Romanomermis culicivorax TaxID=13658 RepID=A0A915IE10_ROMCU
MDFSFRLFFTLLYGIVNCKEYFRGYNVDRIFVNSSQNIIKFKHWVEKFDGVDIWHIANHVPFFLDLSVSPRIQEIFDNYVNEQNFGKTVLVDDLGSIVDYPPKTKRNRRSNDQQKFSLYRYNSFSEIMKWLADLKKNYESLVDLEEIGQSFEKRPILVVKIGKSARNHVKPAVWIDAGIHSREWLSVATALYVINEFMVQYSRNESSIVNLIDRVDFHIAPVINPDGYEYSRSMNRLWRKTRSRHEILVDQKKITCVGVDANRNFDYFWGSVDDMSDDNGSCSDGYSGPSPGSEPETRSISSALRRLKPSLMAYLTLHSYGQMWLSPWGYAAYKPSNYQRQRDMALLAIDALQGVHGTPYSFGTVSDLLYPASGTSVDFAHSLNITYAYAIELRPGETGVVRQNPFRGFMQQESQIEPTGQETFAAFAALTEAILNES